MSALTKVKARMLELGVAPSVVASVTEQDLARANDPVRVSVLCHKCDQHHEISHVTYEQLFVRKGYTTLKCGWCYL
jgi:hypothetical protein